MTPYQWLASLPQTHEVAGPRSNAMVLAWIHRWFRRVDDDSSIAWCGIAMFEAHKETKRPTPKQPYRAISWLGVGSPVPIASAELGDVVILDRHPGHHVGCFVRMDGDRVVLLGGNQGNAIREAQYPAINIIGVRRP